MPGSVDIPAAGLGSPDEVAIAVEVKADFKPQSAAPKDGHPALTITQGEIGWAFKSSRKDGWVICQINPTSSDERIGWVSEKYLNPGKPKADELPIDIPRAQSVQSAQAGAAAGPLTPNTALEKAVSELWINIVANRAMLENELPSIQDSDKTKQRLFDHAPHYADIIIKAIRGPANPKVRALIQNGNFDPLTIATELRNTRITVKGKAPSQPGIYARIYPRVHAGNYYIFKYVVTPDTGFYIGQVGDAARWVNRRQKHDEDMYNDLLQHYKLANTMTDQRETVMIPLVTFNPNDAAINQAGGLDAVLAAAELTFVCLFRCWHPLLLGPDSNLSQTASHWISFRSAKAFNAIMDVVASPVLSGWRPGRIVGLNWQTPIIVGEIAEKIWCTWHDTERRRTVFRCRRRLIVVKNSNGSIKELKIGLATHSPLAVPIKLAQEAGITESRQVDVVVEFTDNGEDHEAMFVRFPRLGPNPAFDILRTMAIKIEFADENANWKTSVITRSKIWNTPDAGGAASQANAPNLPVLYFQGLGIATSLLGITYTNGPKWLSSVYTLGRISIKKFVYNHLQQKISLETASTSTRPWPASRRIADNKALIQAQVDENQWGNTTVGSKPASLTPKGRKACDICVSLSSTMPCPGVPGGACNFNEASGTCNGCKLLHRPCTFTSHPQIRQELQASGRYKALGIFTNVQTHKEVQMVESIEAPFDPSIGLQ